MMAYRSMIGNFILLGGSQPPLEAAHDIDRRPRNQHNESYFIHEVKVDFRGIKIISEEDEAEPVDEDG